MYKFREFDEEEQKDLLRYWLASYSSLLLSDNDLDLFNELLKKDVQGVFDVAVMCFSIGNSNDVFVWNMREGLGLSFAKSAQINRRGLERNDVSEGLEGMLLESLVVGKHNYPFISGMSADEINKNIVSFPRKVQERRIENFFRECSLKSEDFQGDKLKGDFLLGVGAFQNTAFDYERLTKKEDEITAMLEGLPIMKYGVRLYELSMERDERAWTMDYKMVDELLRMATALGKVVIYPAEELFAGEEDSIVFECGRENREKYSPKVYEKKAQEYSLVVDC